MIICECTGTSDATIRALAREGVTKVPEVTRRCGAGGCCQSCRPTIARILKANAVVPAPADAPAQPLPMPATF
jgi:bacterioferritin-associated ferredoxin